MYLQLMNGAYEARSVIAGAQRCVNLFPEINQRATILSPYMPQQTAPTLMTHYPTPGLTLLATAAEGPVRGLFRSNNGVLYMVAGTTLYSVSNTWVLTPLGTIPFATTPVSMTDNGQTMVLVDGSSSGWTYSNAGFAPITDSSFYGSRRVDYMDTFLLFARPNSQTWYCSLSNETSFDPLYLANKTGYADNLQTIIVCARQVWLLGEVTTEVWYDAGTPDFPFAAVPGGFVPHGCIAPYSAATQDINVFWLSHDLQGRAIVLQGQGYSAMRISTHAIENEISGYSTIADAIGFCYQQEGHVFYVLQFPSADKTWVYDLSTRLWHERMWLDGNGVEHRWRPNCAAYCYETNVVGDWQTGALYSLDMNNYTDNGQPIRRIRSFPHLVDGLKRIVYNRFVADMETGTYPSATVSPTVSLRWSDTRGATWKQPITRSLGQEGQPQKVVQFRRLGMARDRVFELSWSAATATALNGAAIDLTEAQT